MAIIWKQRGGAHVGPWFFPLYQATWPFATLEFHDDGDIKLKFFPFRRSLRSSEINLVEFDRGLFYKLFWPTAAGIKIHYQGMGPILVKFVSYSPDKALAHFEEAGIKVVA